MLFKILHSLLVDSNQNKQEISSNMKKDKKKLTPQEKSKLEYELWVRAEEYEEEE